MSVVLSEHLPLLASAPDGIQKLRGLILELAVRGKLVPQDPNDEPASELLKLITHERSRLEAEGVCKKLKPVRPVDADEHPFSLPDGWSWVRNGNLFSLRKGKVPKDLGEHKTEIPYLDIEALDRGNVRRYTTDLAAPRSKDNDILVVCDGSRSGLVLNGRNGAIGSTLAVIESPKIIQPFIKLIFRQCFDRLNSTMKGAAIPHLDTAKLVLDVVGLPPLSEQHRIVAKIDELMALCDRLDAEQADAVSGHARLVETLLGTLTQSTDAADLAANWHRLAEHFDTLFITEASIDTLKQTVLQLAVMGKLVRQDPSDETASAFLKRVATEREIQQLAGICKKAKPLPSVQESEKLFALPPSWEWTRLGCLSEIIGGFAFKSEHFLENGVHQVLRLGNIRPDHIRVDENPVFIDSELAKQCPEFCLKKNDILISMTGTREKRDYLFTAQVAENPTNGRFFYINQRVGAIRPFGCSDYLNKVLKVESIKNSIFSTATGSANQGNIGISALRDWAIPIPPPSEQKRIVAKVDELMALCDGLKADLAITRQCQAKLAETLIESALEAA